MAATGVGEIIVHGVVDYVFARGVTGMAFVTLCVPAKNTDVTRALAGSERDHLHGFAELQAPISMIMEAKAEDTFDNGFGQAVAQCTALRNSQQYVAPHAFLHALLLLTLRRVRSY